MIDQESTAVRGSEDHDRKADSQRLSGRLGSSSDAFATAYHPSFAGPQGDVIQHGAPFGRQRSGRNWPVLKMAKGDGRPGPA